MRIIICNVYNTAFEYKDKLKKFNYEHVLNDFSTNDVSDYSKFDYTDYITINTLDDIFEITKIIDERIIIHTSNSGLYDEPYLEIYDDYRE